MKVKTVGVVAVVATVLAGAALAVGISSHSRVDKTETTKELGVTSFSIGLLDDTTGKLPSGEDAEKDKGGLSTSKFYKFEGLTIESAKDSTVKYCVNYYAEDKSFLGLETYQVGQDFTTSDVSGAGASAQYVKIEIIPTDDDDGEVSIFELPGYVSQLTITVTK